jgi:hypothetical protein
MAYFSYENFLLILKELVRELPEGPLLLLPIHCSSETTTIRHFPMIFALTVHAILVTSNHNKQYGGRRAGRYRN